MFIGLFTELKALGGVQRASRHMAAVLAAEARRRGLPCRLYSLNDPPGPHRDHVGDLAFDFSGCGRSKVRFMVAGLRATATGPALVFAAHPNLATLAWVVKRLTRAKTAVVGHGIDVWVPLPRLRRIAIRSANVVLAVSTDTAERLVRVQGVTPSVVRVVPLALEPVFWSRAEQRGSRWSDGEGRNARFLLSVARLVATDRDKGVDTVIQSIGQIASEFPDLQYVVVGDGDDRSRLERLSREGGAGDRVHFRGHVSPSELVDLYASCEALVLPSRKEGFGLVFVEAMAFGKPVVAGAHGGTTDIVQDGVSGFLTRHGDVDGLATILRRLLSDERLRSEMGRRGVERVRTTYLFEHFYARLGAVIEELCAA